MNLSIKNKKTLFIVILLFAILLRIIVAQSAGYLIDEYETTTWANSYIELIQHSQKDLHPPTIYLVAQGIQSLTNSLFETRLFFMLFFLLTIMIIYLYKTEGLETRLVWALIFSLSIASIFFSIHIRVYIMLMMFSILSTIVLKSIIISKTPELKKSALLGVIYGLSLLLHYYAILFIISHFVIAILYKITKELSLKKNLLSFAVSSVIALIFFSPILPLFLLQYAGAGVYFAPPMRVSAAIVIPWNFATGISAKAIIGANPILLISAMLTFLLFSGFFIKGFIALFKKDYFMICAFCVPILITLAATMAHLALANTRYLIFLLPIYCYIISVGITTINKRFKLPVIAAIIASSLVLFVSILLTGYSILML